MPVVLIVDDNESVAGMAAACAEMAGCESEIAHDGQAALNAVRSHHIDLMILDAHMPGLSGLDVLRELKSERAPPVAVYSADEGVRQEALQLGAVAFLRKTKPEELLQFIEEHCQ